MNLFKHIILSVNLHIDNISSAFVFKISKQLYINFALKHTIKLRITPTMERVATPGG